MELESIKAQINKAAAQSEANSVRLDEIETIVRRIDAALFQTDPEGRNLLLRIYKVVEEVEAELASQRLAKERRVKIIQFISIVTGGAAIIALLKTLGLVAGK